MARLRQFAAGLLLAGVSVQARAATDADPTPVVWVQASGAYATYKSGMVQSNDTSLLVDYAVGVYAGQDRALGMLLERESGTFSFTLDKATVAETSQDTVLRYRYGPLHLGLMFVQQTIIAKEPPLGADGKPDATQAATDFINVVTSGYGADLGLRIPVGRRGSVGFRGTYETTGSVQQKTPDVVGTKTPVSTFGPRLELDFGGSWALTSKTFDAIAGFKDRTWSATIDGVAAKEQITAPYLGLAAHWLF